MSTVAIFEFLATVKRPGYLITTFGMPLFMAGYAGIAAIPIYFAEKQAREPAVHGIVDQSGLLRLAGDIMVGSAEELPAEIRRGLEAAGHKTALDGAIGPPRLVFRPFADEAAARAELAARRLAGFFVIPADYLKDGRIMRYSPDAITLAGGDASNAFVRLLRDRLVSGRLDPALAVRVMRPVEATQRFAVTGTGEIRDRGEAASLIRLVVPLVFMLLFLLSVLMTSGYLMQGTATEKENKVVEVLLASADPDQILAGKLLGLGTAGLLQIGLWLAMASTTILGLIPLVVASTVDLPVLAVALALPFFAVSFLFFGGLILGTGSLGTNVREAQQLAMVWSLTAALPMFLMMFLLRDPNGTVARALTWLPFTSGQVVVLRASMDAASLAWWEIAGAFAVLMASTWAALRLGARLFRIGLLSIGSRPTFREVLRQARLAG